MKTGVCDRPVAFATTNNLNQATTLSLPAVEFEAVLLALQISQPYTYVHVRRAMLYNAVL